MVRKEVHLPLIGAVTLGASLQLRVIGGTYEDHASAIDLLSDPLSTSCVNTTTSAETAWAYTTQMIATCSLTTTTTESSSPSPATKTTENLTYRGLYPGIPLGLIQYLWRPLLQIAHRSEILFTVDIGTCRMGARSPWSAVLFDQNQSGMSRQCHRAS
jgi:hypothetical protein